MFTVLIKILGQINLSSSKICIQTRYPYLNFSLNSCINFHKSELSRFICHLFTFFKTKTRYRQGLLFEKLYQLFSQAH